MLILSAEPMKSGKVVEFGETAKVFANPSHPYTQALLDSIPGRDWNAAKAWLLRELTRA